MFELTSRDSGARAGVLHLSSRVETPCFLPVATKASVKTLSSQELEDVGTLALISNALLLYLQPGVEAIEEAGGLHRFMGWERAIFTDNGGFQALRPEFHPRVSRRGIKFISPFDNSSHLMTPEKVVEIQEKLGSDVALALDDCPPYGTGYRRARESVDRTIAWAERSLGARDRGQHLFAISQGGVYPGLRRECVRKLAEMDFQGYALGGLSIGEPKETMGRMISATCEALPEEKPRYLMGVGSPLEILEAIARGIDIFDSAFPTRNARHSAVYTQKGKYSISKAKNLKHLGPLEEGCSCFSCRNYSRGYISHLMRVHEYLGMRLVTLHNLHFMQELMKGARRAVEGGEFDEFRERFAKRFAGH